MEATRPAALIGGTSDTARIAKAALRRLAIDRLEPSPDNYAAAFAREAGEPPAANDGPAIAALIERIVRGVERSSRGWTAARKKDSLQRVLDGSRSDARRLQQRLAQLVASWDVEVSGGAATAPAALDDEAGATPPAPFADAGASGLLPLADAAAGVPARVTDAATTHATRSRDAGDSAALPLRDVEATAPSPAERAADPAPAWGRIVGELGGTLQQALPVEDAAPHAVAQGLATLVEAIRRDGPTPARVAELERLCRGAAPVLQHRHRLVDQLRTLCTELTASLTDLAEDDSWAQGQCAAMQLKIGEGLNARGIRAVSELLRDTRERQSQLRVERARARDSLKGLIHKMLSELDQLGAQTGGFHESVGRYADVIEKADSLESLAGAVRELVEESRGVQALVQQTQMRLQQEHRRAGDLSQRVVDLESEMRRLSDEVSTDQLTQVANRRGLLERFGLEQERLTAGSGALSVALLDIDNFKRLNDRLGHGAGDEALRSLAARISATLRPGDHVARYGGEEFVVLLPETPPDQGAQVMTRLQRALTQALFMHEGEQVFVTFSAGLTAYRGGERLEDALERADQALYEAKRTGKNRTCLG